jgi:hypothetical protein
MMCYNKHHYPHLPLPESVTNRRVCVIQLEQDCLSHGSTKIYCMTSFVMSPFLLESFSSTQTKRKLDKGQSITSFTRGQTRP